MKSDTYAACLALGAPLDLLAAYNLALVRHPADSGWHRAPSSHSGCGAAAARAPSDALRANYHPISLLLAGEQLCGDARCAWPEAARFLLETFAAAATAAQGFETAIAQDDAAAALAALDRLAGIEAGVRAKTASRSSSKPNAHERFIVVARWLSELVAERRAIVAVGEDRRYDLAALRLAAVSELTVDRRRPPSWHLLDGCRGRSSCLWGRLRQRRASRAARFRRLGCCVCGGAPPPGGDLAPPGGHRRAAQRVVCGDRRGRARGSDALRRHLVRSRGQAWERHEDVTAGDTAEPCCPRLAVVYRPWWSHGPSRAAPRRLPIRRSGPSRIPDSNLACYRTLRGGPFRRERGSVPMPALRPGGRGANIFLGARYRGRRPAVPGRRVVRSRSTCGSARRRAPAPSRSRWDAR